MTDAHVLVNTVSLSSGALRREQHILRELATQDDRNRYDVICTPRTRESLAPTPSNFRLHESPKPANTVRRIVWENTALQRSVKRFDPDVLYFPLHITNAVDRCPKVGAVRNVAPFFSEAHSGANIPERLRLRILRMATSRTVSQSERVVFMSASTRDRVARHVPSAEGKSVVIPHGVPDGFESIEPSGSIYEAHALPDRFLLTVANISRYKNLVELVDGYAIARRDVDLPPLCIAGKVVETDYASEVRDRISAHGLDNVIRFLGFVDHDDLPELHAASDMFVFSSACENAPMTLIEALACGSAIACSNVASMPEICRDAAAYFDPASPEEIGATLARLWASPAERTRLEAEALERAADFSWAAAARKTSELFSTVAQEG